MEHNQAPEGRCKEGEMSREGESIRVNSQESIMIRANHLYAFRSGEWASCVRVACCDGRPCYMVTFADGTADAWPIADSQADYEFCSPRGVRCTFLSLEVLP
ncbi:hypothetical protein LCGC14_2349830 [marine sediment metagenome]|uniref:Uncharacterized protein n=1 Tax=marine sediment metagenome TaxID=412755 RepID=A0A0F9EM77_9ZZZZ